VRAATGHYEILAPLGAGGMAEVWHGRDTRLNREVVDFRNDRVDRGIQASHHDLNRPHPDREPRPERGPFDAAERRRVGTILARRQVHEGAQRLANRLVVWGGLGDSLPELPPASSRKAPRPWAIAVGSF
jgi:hypothetical protein